jgi:RNA 2',3'-cyclic 3'-phosphodiesterase
MELRPTEERSPLDGKLRAFITLSPPAGWWQPMKNWESMQSRRFSTEFGRWCASGAHLTLRFLGTITMAEVLEISQRLEALTKTISPFTLEGGKLDFFPNWQDLRVVWMGVGGDRKSLFALEEEVRNATRTFGTEPDDREFVPHLTLARISRAWAADRKTLNDMIEAGAAPELPEWRVTEVELIKSELGQGGSTYTRLAGFRLGA